jgi:3-oxoacyl-[acyl-carrier-protein] synthase-3
MGWRAEQIDRTICHQVGAAHQRAILRALALPERIDFTTFAHLGNMGSVSLPLTAAIAAERGELQRGDKVALLGIGSGLNCLMLGLEW